MNLKCNHLTSPPCVCITEQNGSSARVLLRHTLYFVQRWCECPLLGNQSFGTAFPFTVGIAARDLTGCVCDVGIDVWANRRDAQTTEWVLPQGTVTTDEPTVSSTSSDRKCGRDYEKSW